jgi:2-polyprenyl-3-methyl-5-hydroxy-6-metoxy-1,4-benzoquinol methylase
MKIKSWNQYNENPVEFFNSYISIAFESIFNDVMSYLPAPGSSGLDIGAGSGRDSAALASLGFKMTAVEPSSGLRNLAIKHHKSLDINWLDDCLPDLKVVKKLNVNYDFVLLSAVWMHLPPEERQESLHSVSRILKPGGLLFLTLRLGPAEPDRIIYEISTEEALIKSKEAGLDIKYINPIKRDNYMRSKVMWQILVLNKPHDFS